MCNFRMETDDDLFYQYLYNKNTRRYQPSDCDPTCRQKELCNIRTVTGDDNTACMEQAPSI